MSDLRIALVAEGPTDYVILEAALKAILNKPFILSQLQPEETQPEMGTGWGGVLKWCMHLASRHQGRVEQDPTLVDFDLLIIHLDVDVSAFDYAQCGEAVAQLAGNAGWGALPCAALCPPVEDSVNALTKVLQSWLTPAKAGAGTVLCLPAQSSGTWLAAALLPPEHKLLARAECDPNVESSLSQLPKQLRVRKSKRDYRQKAPLLTEHWHSVKAVCRQAGKFEADILAALNG